MPARERSLVAVADDFGFTPDVNEGIVEAHRRGIVRAASLMATGAAFEHAVELARRTPTLEVGAHLTLVGLPSARNGRPLPATVPVLLTALARGRMRVYEEFRAQLERILAAGIQPVHLDTHKHTHVIPPVLDAVLRLASEFGIRWIRKPFDWHWSGEPRATARERVSVALMRLLRRSFERKLAGSGIRTTDRFVGLRMTGHFSAADLIALIHALPEGSTELMCHPGYCGPELAHARTRLKESRQRELEALTSPEVFRALEACGVRILGRREL
jgi:predicted glycoside hydrolase/deacetylase ChbG (UPF0249 family)